MKNASLPRFPVFSRLPQLPHRPLSAAETKPTFTLHSQRKAGQTDKVVVLMEVGGEFKERADGMQGKEQRVAMSGVCRLTYHEKTLEAAPGRRRAVRYYEKAESAVKFKDGGHSPSLGAERRLVGVAVDAPVVTLFSLREPLSRDELEVIDILGNSLLLDDLLPERPVAVGDAWKPDDKVVAALLGLGGATRCDVQCVLKEVTDDGRPLRVGRQRRRTGQRHFGPNPTQGQVSLRSANQADRLVRVGHQGGPRHQPGGRRLRRRGAAANDRSRRKQRRRSWPSEARRPRPRADARSGAGWLSVAARPLADPLRPPLVSQQRRPRKRRC